MYLHLIISYEQYHIGFDFHNSESKHKWLYAFDEMSWAAYLYAYFIVRTIDILW